MFNETVDINELSKSLEEKANTVTSHPKPDFSKDDFEWRNELLKAGLVENSRMFTIPNQKAPLFISIADKKHMPECGSNPRIAISTKHINDEKLNGIFKKYGVEIVKSHGWSIDHYDFKDVKPVSSLVNTLATIVREYDLLS
jgi:hypothetical protein